MRPDLLASAGLDLELVIGNPAALAANRRYIDRDLNRSFAPELLADRSRTELEITRARELLEAFGPEGAQPCPVVLCRSITTGQGRCPCGPNACSSSRARRISSSVRELSARSSGAKLRLRSRSM